MILTCLASGSSGNCYVLKDNKGKMLLLDAGIPIMKIKKGCDWKVSDIVGCVVTHKHGDHSEAVSDLEEMGIPVYKPYEDNSYIGGYGEFRIVSVPMMCMDASNIPMQTVQSVRAMDSSSSIKRWGECSTLLTQSL
jgi:glyoxylase-like metal-dependent hydrolase (beta-lactamase superfamily II)